MTGRMAVELFRTSRVASYTTGARNKSLCQMSHRHERGEDQAGSMFKQASIVGAAVLLSGCATAFYDARTAGPMLEQAAKLPPASLRAHSSCSLAFATTGATKADFTQGACAYTDTTLYLYSWDASTKQYRREIQLEFAGLKGISKVKLGMWTQLQTPVDGGQIVFEPKSADAVHDLLKKAGVKDLPSSGYVSVNAPPQPQTIYIPVYVGN